MGTTTRPAQSSSRTGSSARSTKRLSSSPIPSSYAVTRMRCGTDSLPRQHRHVAVARHPDRVEAGRQQPPLGPGPHVAIGHLVEGREEVGQGGVAEAVAGQVGVQPGQEGLVAEPGGQLAQRGVALGVGDHVEVVGGGVDIGHVLRRGRDGVGRPALVGVEGRRLAPDLAGEQGTRLTGGVTGDAVAHVVGERLLQPGVLPPGHRDQVAEPHVRHLVGDGRGALGPLQVGQPAARQVLVAVGHAPRRLQRSPVLARHERLVVGVEGVGLREQLAVVVEARDRSRPVGPRSRGRARPRASAARASRTGCRRAPRSASATGRRRPRTSPRGSAAWSRTATARPHRSTARPLASTDQAGSAVTLSSTGALRSFWSKQAKTRWAMSMPTYADT